MRLIFVTLVSVLGYSLADILKVKCGDELCEKPSNLAVTTLRYIPDKPYKLQIVSLNSEVEIFGVTDDLYYAKYGRNFGFLPKNHLREKSRGHYEHSIEINFDDLKLNSELKEKNYLHEVLKSSQSVAKNVSETDGTSQVSTDDKQVESEIEKKEEERPTDYIPIGTEPKIPESLRQEVKPAIELADEVKEVKQPEPPKVEEKKPEELEQPKVEAKEEVKKATETENDSGIEDEDEDDEDSEDDENEEDDEELDVFDSPEKKNETSSTEVPETVAKENIENVVLNETSSNEALDIKPAEVVEEIKVEENTVVNSIDENSKTDEEAEKPKETQEEPPKVVEIDEAINKTETVEVKENVEQKLEEEQVKVEEKAEEPLEKVNVVTEQPKDPAPVFEEVIEEKIEPVTTEKTPELVPETPLPFIEEPTTTTPSYEPVTELPEIKQEHSTEVPPPPSQEKREVKMDQDLLLKRFNEKLYHKSAEGIGSVEQVHKHHSHSEQAHEHLHNSHSDKNDDVKEEVIQQDLDKKPGFFGGLVKKIFGDEHDDTKEHIETSTKASETVDEGFCEKIDSENCPKSLKKREAKEEALHSHQEPIDSKTMEDYFKMILNEAVDMVDVIITMGLVSITVLIFIFGHYCISKASKEGELIKKMNVLERELMASVKENGTLKFEVDNSKQQLKSIQDNSFGSNDMVIALKNDLEFVEREKEELLEKVAALEKELEAAAEDGLELNKMVSELLSNQTGSDSIISSVEDLQKQLNEQQETIVTMNEALAAKSRENTDLQIQLSEINGKFSGEFEKFQQQVDAIMLERSNLQIELENLKRESDMQINQIIEERNSEVTRLNNELTSYAGKYDENKKLLTAAESKVQALEECIDTIKMTKGGVANVKNLMDVADLKADLLAVTKEKSTIQEQLQSERDSRKLLEERVKAVSEEMSNLKREFSVAEKEKLDAQTRLDVLSNYFKEKEMQLQQELSVKEARWMKQQGETTSTVEKVQALNAEIQTLKSQNDELKAEFEAQVLSYKAKLSNVEAQSHSAWLTAKQAERKLEESRMEAATLRRRLTSIAENPTASADLLNGVPNDSINSIPSPMRVESPNNISLPPPPLMMPPFLPGAPPFLPPPFMPGEMSLPGIPPLGRLMSPPPKRFTPTMRDDRDRYSPRGRYSPDSRYDDYTPFETETDISPPRSPVPRRGYSSPTDRNKKSKGGHNSEQPSRRK